MASCMGAQSEMDTILRSEDVITVRESMRVGAESDRIDSLQRCSEGVSSKERVEKRETKKKDRNVAW